MVSTTDNKEVERSREGEIDYGTTR